VSDPEIIYDPEEKKDTGVFIFIVSYVVSILGLVFYGYSIGDSLKIGPIFGLIIGFSFLGIRGLIKKFLRK
jgi:hypothetical protein